MEGSISLEPGPSGATDAVPDPSEPPAPLQGTATATPETPPGTPGSVDVEGGGPDRSDGRRRRPRDRQVLLVVPPILAFLFAEGLLSVAAALVGATSDLFSPSHWARYDSGLYAQMAAHGVTLTRCTGPAYPPHSVCGTVGWAPLYPGLMWLFGHLGFTLGGAGTVLAVLFAYLTLQAVWVLIGPSWTFSSLCCLAFAACFPGTVYYYAAYPVSLLAFLAVVALILFVRRHYLLAGLVGALCAWAFAIGPLVGVVFLVSAVVVERGWERWRAAAYSAGVALAGFAALLLATQWWVGDWHAYFRAQQKYGNGLHDPISTFVTAFTGGPTAKYPLQDPNPAYNHLAPKAQTAFVAALVIGLVAVVGVRAWRRKPVGRAEWVILSYTVVFWLLPILDGPSLGRYRVEALLVPCAALCTRLPRLVQVALVGTSAVLAVGLASLFTQSVLF